MPSRQRTREDYGRRVARAMALIASRLDDPPGLEALAEAAAFSPFHFHRVYREVAGETPVETLARARLSRAAVDLLRGPLPIARVARRAGYGSAAAFTRAFRAAYGVPPGAYRARGGLGALPPRPGFASRETAMHSVTFRDEPALRLAVLRHIGPYEAIGPSFDRLLAWAGPRGLFRPETRSIALYHDDPLTVPAAQLRSDAGITVPPDVSAEGEVRILEVPAARCAVLRFKGPYAELEPVYSWLYGSWLPGSGEEPADQPVMEEYLNDPRSLPPSEWLTEILLPLRVRVAAV
ncbi:AraC family transcriptional regulator [Paracraurococcus ruber]|uniref:AraC family transcriptional regulator n=1 Tax=Paracraurococcus ruber TaxID=77675 RepID=A0ABS1CYT1_9PROT|nr:AraC family transcriptional regulator [Paracraurococcus ruber]MBK1659667.1 AraC family transcriptional regulator [Paracraurococcus ruber]TDG29034.1 AraC family transcriptional regulator [Paracraurococcus ruber]